MNQAPRAINPNPTAWFQRIGSPRYSTENTTKTDRVITFCMVFNCAALNYPCPVRLAGTCNIYSNSAIPQLTAITISSGAALNFRCPYQAKVLKTLDMISSPMVCTGMKSDIWDGPVTGFAIAKFACL